MDAAAEATAEAAAHATAETAAEAEDEKVPTSRREECQLRHGTWR